MKNTEQKLSLWSAILININIIIGSGIFINTTELARRAGLLGALSYSLVGALLFPLILCFVQLLQYYPNGGFYSFSSSSLHPIAGFLNTWIYFTTKLSSATLVIHVFVVLMQKIFPVLATYNTIGLDIFVLIILLSLNMFNVRTGSMIQNWLMVLKTFPIFFVIISGLFFLQGTNLTAINHVWEGIPATIPLVLHAMLGFEVACSISRNIKNPAVNAPKAVLISYMIVITLYVLYQGFFYAILGHQLAEQLDYRTAFPLLINKFAISEYTQRLLEYFIHIAIAASALSAGFGVIYANLWNLYSLAELNYTFIPAFIMKRNRFNIPFMCVLTQGLISITYLCLMKGEATNFQQLSSFGMTITYIISILGLLATLLKNNKSIKLPLLGLLNCCILLSASFYTLWWSRNGLPFYIFAGLTIIGLCMFIIKHNQKKVIT